MQWLDVPDLDWAAGLALLYNNDRAIAEWRDKSWEQTITYIKRNRGKIDIFLCYLYPEQIDVNAIKEIRKLGIPCINFYCDHVRQFRKLPNQFKGFDLMWVPEYEALKMYDDAKVKSINLPMPIWVDERFRNAAITELPIISFIGSKDLLREKLLSDAIKNGLDISVRGNGWLNNYTSPAINDTAIKNKLVNQFNFIRQHGLSEYVIKTWQRLNPVVSGDIDPKYLLPSPDFEEYVNLTRNSKITLGINRVPTFKRLHSNPLIYSRLRDIEAPMLGACYLTEYSTGLSNLYNLENEVYTYKTVDELIAKATELSENKNKRDQLRKNGQRKALTELTIPVSLNKIKVVLFQ